MEKIHLRRLTQHCWKGDQSWNYQATWDTGQHRLRVTFKRDSYEVQSYARVEVLDPDRVTWNPLHQIPIRETGILKIGAYQDGVTVHNFSAAEEMILDEATTIIYGKEFSGPKIELRDVSVKFVSPQYKGRGHISFRVFVDDDSWGFGDLWAVVDGDLDKNGLPTVGGSGDWLADDDMIEEVRVMAIEKAKSLGLNWWVK